MEIERKYKVAVLPQHLEQYEALEIEQGYLCASPTLRVRKVGDAFVLTVKEAVPTASTAAHNREEEFQLSPSAYAKLRAKCDGQLVTKTRYRIPLSSGEVAELDVFHGRHEGLCLVEVEFGSTAEADRFVKPAWFGDDVSSEPAYRNVALAGL